MKHIESIDVFNLNESGSRHRKFMMSLHVNDHSRTSQDGDFGSSKTPS